MKTAVKNLGYNVFIFSTSLQNELVM